MSAIGIDLGTTNCCTAVVIEGRSEIVINSYGKRTTPSVIGLWEPKEIAIGSTAEKVLLTYPESIVTGVKYNMGKNYDDAVNKKMLLNHNNKLMYSIKRGDAYVNYLPEELSAMLLKAMKSYAKDFLDKDVSNAVITVPTYFDDLQREATISAGKIAGFTEIKLLNESVAAAVAYGVVHKISDNQNVFIFDFGGGTLDVSILKYSNNEYNVLAIDGDLHLGGNDITNILLKYVLDKTGKSDNTNNRYLSRLLQLCEETKIELSNQNKWFFEILEINEEINITIETFIQLTNELFDKVMLIVERCLKNAQLTINDINDIVLVGGSSRIPAIQNRLRKFFEKDLKKNINPDEVVAQGAAIVAANWNKSGFEQIKLNTILAHSIGIEILGKDMMILLPKFSKLPIKNYSRQLSPREDDQTSVIVKIFSGEDQLTENNTFLGSLRLENISIEPSSNVRYFTVTLEITDDGIFNVTTVDNSEKVDKTTITLDKANLSESDIQSNILKMNAENIK